MVYQRIWFVDFLHVLCREFYKFIFSLRLMSSSGAAKNVTVESTIAEPPAKKSRIVEPVESSTVHFSHSLLASLHNGPC